MRNIQSDRSFFFLFVVVVLTCGGVSGDLVEGLNLVEMNLRQGLLSRTSQMSVPVIDKTKPINVTLGMELKKIVDVSNILLFYVFANFSFIFFLLNRLG